MVEVMDLRELSGRSRFSELNRINYTNPNNKLRQEKSSVLECSGISYEKQLFQISPLLVAYMLFRQKHWAFYVKP